MSSKLFCAGCLNLLRTFFFKNTDYKVKTSFVKVKFNDFQSTTVERAWQGVDAAHFHELLQQGLERSELRVRLIGAGVKFYDESDASDMQLDFLDLLLEKSKLLLNWHLCCSYCMAVIKDLISYTAAAFESMSR